MGFVGNAGGTPLSYRDVQELLSERGIDVCYTTIYRWVIEFSPLITTKKIAPLS